MLMRRTIGISVAFMVISTGAMAAPPETAATYLTNQPCGDKSKRAAQRTGKTHVVSVRPAHSSVRRHEAAKLHAAHHHDAAPAELLGGRQIGKAAWYNHVGRRTASGERLDTVTPTAAHRTLPLLSYARVTHLDSGRSVIVKINDRGPWRRRFIIDLSPRAAHELKMRQAGVVPVVVEPITASAAARGSTVAAAQSSDTYTTQ